MSWLLALQNFAAAHPWLRNLAEVLRSAAFLGFLVLGLRVVWKDLRKQETSRAKTQLIVYAILVTCTVGVTQIEAWPFSNWALIHHISQQKMLDWIVEGTDASGKAYRIDPRFIEPMPYEDFDTWLKTGFFRIGRTEEEAKLCYLVARPPTPGQAKVAGFLIERAEIARRRFLHGEPPGTNGTLIGRLAAPYHFDRPTRWRTVSDVPATPFVGLRIWQIEWNVEERYRDESRITRHLLFDYRL
jgi:hypothetical protein